MKNANTASSDRRSQVHTEVRAPIEAVVTRVVWFVFGVIEVLIAVRFVVAHELGNSRLIQILERRQMT